MDTYLSWAKDFVSWLWTKGWRGKLAAVVVGGIVLLGVAGIWGLPKLQAAPVTVVPASPVPTSPIKGAVSRYSPDGWPIIKDKIVRLSGVRPIVASKHLRFAEWITSHGGYLECDSSNGGDTYRCLTAQRLDVAQTVLLNGAAQATCDADPLYRAAEETAKRIAGGRSANGAVSCP